MSQLYPYKFETLFKEKLWGGDKIKTVLNKDYGDLENCGETWELSGVQGNISKVANGPDQGTLLTDLIKVHKENLLGKSVFQHFGDEFPLLIKFIDAAQDLSIQVHPDDEMAKRKHNGFGKSEMWYILGSDAGAQLNAGFNQPLSKEKYLDYFNSGKLEELLNMETVNKGDVFYLPAGRVHYIGAGVMLAEIQQTSDITYRIYDFDRKDKDGNKRELHVEDALEAIDFEFHPEYKTSYQEPSNSKSKIISTPFFTTNKLCYTEQSSIDRSQLDCFKIYIGVGGAGKIAEETIKFGEVLLVPATMNTYEIEPDGQLELLETYIEL